MSIPKITVGYRAGSLCVEVPTGQRKSGYTIWRCRCDCGNETVVRQTNLQSGKTKSYGCLQASQILENLKLCDGTSVAILEADRKKRLRSNTSGVTSVYRSRSTQKWCAQITFRHKTYFLGAYENKADAVQACKRGEAMHEDFLAWYHAAHEQTEGRPGTPSAQI